MKKLVGCFLMVCFLLGSNSAFANRSNAVDLEKFIGEYELVEDKFGTCEKWGLEGIIVEYETSFFPNYNDVSAPPVAIITKDSLQIRKVSETNPNRSSYQFTKINREKQKSCSSIFECDYYKATKRGNTIKAFSSASFQLGWNLDKSMTLKGNELRFKRPRNNPDYSIDCTYERVESVNDDLNNNDNNGSANGRQCNKSKLDSCLKYGGGNGCYSQWCK